MYTDLFKHMFTYNPEDLDPEIRTSMSALLMARAEYLIAQAEVMNLRSRIWGGEKNLDSFAELKAAELAKVREDYSQRVQAIFKDAVDVDGLAELIPMIAGGVLQNFTIPLPVLLEATGLDLDYLKIIVEKLKGLFEE